MSTNYLSAMAYPTAESRDIAASAEKLWSLVWDQGTNRRGVRRWSTTVTVVGCELAHKQMATTLQNLASAAE
jgi:hypothetical protein